MIRCALISGLMILAPHGATALSLEFPGRASAVAEKSAPNDSYFLPTEPFVDGPIAGVMAEGAVRQETWKLNGGSLTTLQILAPLRAQLLAEGYEPLFECESQVCGGFDFRYQIDVMPEPDMHVNLGDYRYLAARKGANDYVGLIVSRSANAGFVQLTRIGAVSETASFTTSTKAPPPTTAIAQAGPVGEQLETAGHATLGDLIFDSGSSQLGVREYSSLANLASYLNARPDRQVVLVGHTDAEGPLDRNIVLSRKRADAVMDRLASTYGVSPSQMSADGVGFLAPRASNLTIEGRTQNRRVEVILRSTQ